MLFHFEYVQVFQLSLVCLEKYKEFLRKVLESFDACLLFGLRSWIFFYGKGPTILYSLGELLILYNVIQKFLECLLQVSRIFCTRLEIWDLPLSSQFLRSLITNFLFVYHVYFISKKNYFSINFLVLLYPVKPIIYVFKAHFICDVIYHYHTGGQLVVRKGLLSVSLLPCCIPDFHFDIKTFVLNVFC